MKQVKLAVPVGLLVVTAALSTALLWGPAFGQDKAAKVAVKWEYKVIPYSVMTLEDSLNKLGEDGWDYAADVAPAGGGFGGGKTLNPKSSAIILKRAKQ